VTPVFEDRFQTVLEYPLDNRYHDMGEWVDKNSTGNVSIKLSPPQGNVEDVWYAPAGIIRKRVFFGFENSDDALFFKIKYSV
jgi:hypothetical protein